VNDRLIKGAAKVAPLIIGVPSGAFSFTGYRQVYCRKVVTRLLTYLILLLLQATLFCNPTQTSHSVPRLTRPLRSLSVGYVEHVEFSPNSKYLAVGSVGAGRGSDCVSIYDTRTWKPVKALVDEKDGIFSPDGKVLATFSGEDNRGHQKVSLWSTRHWKRNAMLPVRFRHLLFWPKGHSKAILTRRVAPLNTWIERQEFWDLGKIKRIKTYHGDRAPVGFASEGNKVIRIRESKKPGRQYIELRSLYDSNFVRNMGDSGDFLPEMDRTGRIAVVEGRDLGECYVWDVTHGIKRFLLKERGPVRNLAVSGDGEWLVTVGDEWDSRLWNLKTGKKAALLAGGKEPVYAVSISDKYRLIAVGGKDGIVWIWPLPKTRKQHR
jgi:WD40 repeat protein